VAQYSDQPGNGNGQTTKFRLSSLEELMRDVDHRVRKVEEVVAVIQTKIEVLSDSLGQVRAEQGGFRKGLWAAASLLATLTVTVLIAVFRSVAGG
jgi:hypothetical protein